MVKRLLIRLDAGFGVGYGHAVRVDGLLQLLKTPTVPIVLGNVNGLRSTLSQATIHPLANADADFIDVFSAETLPDAILVDLPRRARFPWPTVRKLGVPLIAIDDEGGEVEADLIINGTVPEEYHRYDKVSPLTKYLIGPHYTLIRPAFADMPWQAPSYRHVLIVVGSGERATTWAHKLVDDGLDGLECETAHMVVGSLFPGIDDFRKQAGKHGIEVLQDLDAIRLATLMARSSAALVTGGMVVFEALAVGVPVIAFPQVHNLIPEMRWLAARGCVFDLGYEGGMNMQSVRTAIERLLSNPDLSTSQSAAGRSIIDGHGMRRVAETIDEFLA